LFPILHDMYGMGSNLTICGMLDQFIAVLYMNN
jgi:hypothetical protein